MASPCDSCEASEQGVRAYKDIMPLFRPGTDVSGQLRPLRRLVNDEKRREQDALPAKRAPGIAA